MTSHRRAIASLATLALAAAAGACGSSKGAASTSHESTASNGSSASGTSTSGSATSSGGGGAGGSGAGGAGGSSAVSTSGTTSSGAISGSTASGSSGSTSSSSGGLVTPALPALPAGAGTGNTYYVDPGSTGGDQKSGTSPADAWQTLTKVTSFVFQPGDTVLLKGGAMFSGCPVFSPSNVHATTAAPLTIGSYGTGNFTLTANCTGAHVAALTLAGVNGIYVHDAILRGNAGGAEYGILIENPTSTATSGVRIQDCDISGFYTATTSDFGGEIFIAGDPGKLDGISILRNTLHGASGPTSPDDNGITGYGTKGYVTNVLIQENTVFDVGGKPNGPNGTIGNCILACGYDGAVVQYNVVHGCGGNASTCGGPSGIWTFGSNNVVIQYNEAYDVKPAGAAPSGSCDWDGYDLDANVTNSTLQYNYSHDNYGVGLLSYIAETWSGNTIRYNISQNDGQAVAIGGATATTSDLAVYGNTLYATAATSALFSIGGNGGTVSGHVFDNVFYMDGMGQLVDVASWNTVTVTGLQFLGNDYYAPMGFDLTWAGKSYASLAAWGTATGQEEKSGALVGLSVDPKLTAPGTGATNGGYAPSMLSGYRLAKGSPMVGVGLDPKATFGIDPGTSDYFGQTIPGKTGTGYDVGADGSEP